MDCSQFSAEPKAEHHRTRPTTIVTGQNKQACDGLKDSHEERVDQKEPKHASYGELFVCPQM